MGHTLTVRLTKELAAWLERRAAETGQSQSQVVREELERARGGGAGRAFMTLAGTMKGARDLSSRKGFKARGRRAEQEDQARPVAFRRDLSGGARALGGMRLGRID